MIDTPKIIHTTAQSTAVIHITIPGSQIREVMGPGLKELLAGLAQQNITPAGPWFTHHFKNPDTTFDFEIGVPINQPFTPTGRITASQLPAVKVARTIYHGPYESIPAAWGESQKWIAANNHTSAKSLWETYLTNPANTSDPKEFRTELTRPVAT